MPAELEWFANIDNARTRRAYDADTKDFMRFVGIARPEEFRIVTRAHVIAWRKTLEGKVILGRDGNATRVGLSPRDDSTKALSAGVVVRPLVRMQHRRAQPGERSTAPGHGERERRKHSRDQ
jgi:hypothetical protein